MHPGLRKLLEERRKERDRVLREAAKLLTRLRERLGEITVVVYGSYARGDFNLWSDVDLLVISDAFSGVPPLRRIDMIADLLPPKFEVRCLTPGEALLEFRKAWWRNILEEAVLLADDLHLIKRS